MHYLVTRPQPDCKATADRLRALGHCADELPLLVFRADPPDTFDLAGVGALAVTSRRSIDALEGHPQLSSLKTLPVFTVGDRTSQACRDLGFKTVHSADSDVAGLGRLIVALQTDFGGRDVLYLAARDRAGDMGGTLETAGLRCRTVPVYDMAKADQLPAGVARGLEQGSYEGVLIFSRRTGETFTSLLKANGLGHIYSSLPVYAISRQAAASLESFDIVHIAEHPKEDALIDLVLADC